MAALELRRTLPLPLLPDSPPSDETLQGERPVITNVEAGRCEGFRIRIFIPRCPCQQWVETRV